MSYPGYLLVRSGGSYPSAEVQLVYSAAPANRARQWRNTLHSPSSNITETSPSDCLVSYPGYTLVPGVLLLCRSAVGVFYSSSQLSQTMKEYSAFPKLQHYWNLTIRLLSVISRTPVSRWVPTPLQRCSWCILQPQPTAQENAGLQPWSKLVQTPVVLWHSLSD